MRLAGASNIGISRIKLVERTIMVKRLRLRPDPAQNIDIFGAAAISTRMVGVVAVLCLISLTPARDDVNRKTPTAKLIERG